MNGADHFRQAEQLADAALDPEHLDEPTLMRYAATAQVHATLALAAATALPTVGRYWGDETANAEDRRWSQVLT